MKAPPIRTAGINPPGSTAVVFSGQPGYSGYPSTIAVGIIAVSTGESSGLEKKFAIFSGCRPLNRLRAWQWGGISNASMQEILDQVRNIVAIAPCFSTSGMAGGTHQRVREFDIVESEKLPSVATEYHTP